MLTRDGHSNCQPTTGRWNALPRTSRSWWLRPHATVRENTGGGMLSPFSHDPMTAPSPNQEFGTYFSQTSNLCAMGSDNVFEPERQLSENFHDHSPPPSIPAAWSIALYVHVMCRWARLGRRHRDKTDLSKTMQGMLRFIIRIFIYFCSGGEPVPNLRPSAGREAWGHIVAVPAFWREGGPIASSSETPLGGSHGSTCDPSVGPPVVEKQLGGPDPGLAGYCPMVSVVDSWI